MPAGSLKEGLDAHLDMISRLHQPLLLVALLLLGSCLGGCAGLNERASAAMGDYVPQWAGGLPPDAPPRPGTAKYDAWMKERERQRQLPADQRPPDAQASASSSAKPFSWNPSQATSKPASNTSTSNTSTSNTSPTSSTSSASTPSGLDPVH
jgi:hypothetical protein